MQVNQLLFHCRNIFIYQIMKEGKCNRISTSKSFPKTLWDKNDEISRLGGVLSDGRHSWRAHSNRVDILNNTSGQRVASRAFGARFPDAVVTACCEISFGGHASLLVASSSRAGHLICRMNIGTSVLLEAFSVPHEVRERIRSRACPQKKRGMKYIAKKISVFLKSLDNILRRLICLALQILQNVKEVILYYKVLEQFF